MQVPLEWKIPDKIRSRLSQKGGRQRAMVADGHLLLVLHKVPEPGTSDRQIVFFWRSPDGNWHYSKGRGGLPMLKKHLEEYGSTIDQLDAAYRQSSAATDYFRILQSAFPLHRASKRLHQTLQSARESLPQVEELIELRDWAGEFDRISELLQIDVKNALDLTIATQAEEQAHFGREVARTSHRLNLLVAFFLPLTAIASLFGMNLSSGLEDTSPWVFWAIFGLGLFLGFTIRSLVLQGKRSRST
ncbi:MAG: CorA family divalent cation transporter [Cyanobacteriota bacterium]|nr:CorA family divalent cation transporter [Cyanobacteriota bacterium]